MKPINTYLDAAVLKPEMTPAEAEAAIRVCIEHETATACVRPCDLGRAVELCRPTATDVCVVLGFPHGCVTSASKADEARRYIELGADEIDMVVNIGWVRAGMWAEVRSDIAAVTSIAKLRGITTKVIFETSYLTPEAIAACTECCIEAEADFVKTSTGFGGEGATEAGVRTMLDTARGRIKVKPSGGIRDRARAELFVGMGADRLGVGFSSCAAICGTAEAASGTGY